MPKYCNCHLSNLQYYIIIDLKSFHFYSDKLRIQLLVSCLYEVISKVRQNLSEKGLLMS